MTHERESELEKEFAKQCLKYKLPPFEREFLFADAVGRKWRADFAWPAYRLLLELHGLIVMRNAEGHSIVRGGHGTPQGMRNDVEKNNAAIMLGFSVLVFHQGHVTSGDAIAMTQRVLVSRGWDPNKREIIHATEDARS